MGTSPPTSARSRSVIAAAIALTAAAAAGGHAGAIGTAVSFDAGADATLLEGGLLSRTIAIIDGSDDGDPGWEYTVAFGDGSASVGRTLTPVVELNYTYGDGPATHIVTVIVTDAAGEFASDDFTVDVRNVAPVVTVTGAPTSPEGATYTMVVDATDPGDPRDQLSFIVDWRDGSVGAQINRPLGPINHVFLDDADGPDNATTREALVTVSDGEVVSHLTVPIVVTDVAPTIALSGEARVPVGAPYSLDVGAIADPARFDTVTSRTIHWGDGTSDSVTTGGTITHVYATSGTKQIVADLLDEDGSHPAAGSLTVEATPVAPTAPVAFTAATLSRRAIQLRWTNTTTEQSMIYVERCEGRGCTSFVRIATLSGTATTYRNSGLTNHSSYTYRLRSRNVVGYSTYSARATATTRR